MLQAGTIAAFLLVIVSALWSTGYLVDDYEGGNLDVLADALARDADQALLLRPTGELAKLRAEVPNLWFVIRDEQGQHLSEGRIPPEYVPAAALLDQLNDARLGAQNGPRSRPDAVVKWVRTEAGDVQILTGTEGRMSLRRFAMGVSGGFLSVILPVLLLMAAATAIVTPVVVRRALGGLRRTATRAAEITFDRRGVQLPVSDVPIEIGPLVDAVNDALRRLDMGFERHQHFLAQAAHELRTPIAILNARVATLPPGTDKIGLLEDAARLTTLAGQLLDLQRLDQKESRFAPVDLVAMAKQVVFDLAPLAVAAGYDMSFEPEPRLALVAGDHTSLERALTNLVQNAIDHGGRQGTISVRINAGGSIDVADEGTGIARHDRGRIFEPFNRLKPDGRGAGLGLNLVREIMRLHGGDVVVVDGPSKGACLRMTFPAVTDGNSATA